MDSIALVTTIATGCVTAASLLTNLIPTPGPDAPKWQRIGYRVIELVAIVGRRTKENPGAVVALAGIAPALKGGDVQKALALADQARVLVDPPKGGGIGAVAPVLVVLSSPSLIGCAADGTLSPKVARVLGVACQIDKTLQPVLVPLVAGQVNELGPAAAIDQALVHPAVVAACAAAGGKLVADPAPAS